MYFIFPGSHLGLLQLPHIITLMPRVSIDLHFTADTTRINYIMYMYIVILYTIVVNVFLVSYKLQCVVT